RLGGIPRERIRRGPPLSRALLVERRGPPARPLSNRRPLRRDRGAHRRPAGALRARAMAAAGLVSAAAVIANAAHLPNRTRSEPAGVRAETARGRIQNVLLRPAAEAALGDAQPGLGARQAVRPRLHPELRRPFPLLEPAGPLPGVHRPVGPRAARTRRGTC